MPKLISHPDDVTPAWATEVLHDAGALPEGAVIAVDASPIGTGQVADSYRFRLTYDHVDGPPTIVAKFPSEDETSRGNSRMTRTYELETRFYQQLQAKVRIRTPRCYFADIDVDTLDHVLVLEDMAPATQGDQLAGCDADTCALALEQVAGLHAPVWDDAGLAKLDWLNRNSPEGADFYAMFLGSLYTGFLERYSARLAPEVATAGEALFGRLGDYMRHRAEPFTATHGDYRLDNMLFGGGSMATVDWQTVAWGPALSDVSYFMGTSPLPATRAADEQALLREYHQALTAGGIDFSWDQCWDDYRRYAFAGFIMAVGASMLVKQTDRGDDMFMAMADRSARMAIDLETLSMI